MRTETGWKIELRAEQRRAVTTSDGPITACDLVTWCGARALGQSAGRRTGLGAQQYTAFLLPRLAGPDFKQDRESRIIMGWNNEYRSQGMLIPNTISFYGILLESKLRSLSKLTVRLSHFHWK